MDDLEDIEMEKMEKNAGAHLRGRRGGGIPIMGEFHVENDHPGRRTAVVGAGQEVPSFYPRAIRVPRLVEPVEDDTTVMRVEVSYDLILLHRYLYSSLYARLAARDSCAGLSTRYRVLRGDPGAFTAVLRLRRLLDGSY